MNRLYDLGEILLGLFAIALVIGFPLLALFVRVQTSNEVVSGIVYDATFNSFLGNKTCFKVRASEAMAVSEYTSSTYCLNDESPYKAIVEKASRDKSVKVVVKRNKFFGLVSPFRAVDNVEVEEIKKEQ